MPGTLPHLMSRNIVSVVITAFMVIASVNGAEAGRRQVLDTNLVDVSCGGYAPNSVLQSVLVRPSSSLCKTFRTMVMVVGELWIARKRWVPQWTSEGD
jgi:hypothetical protein